MVQGLLNIRGVLAAGFALLGGLYVALPGALVLRASGLAEAPEANFWLIPALGLGLISTGLALFAEPRDLEIAGERRWGLWAVPLVMILYFLTLGLHLRDWWIDDAGITFAYSRSLAEGLGLVAQPWMPPEEGYSSSIWMLLLAAMAWLGADIPLAAKYLGTVCAALCMGICAALVARETRSPLALLICGAGIATAPTVVWAVSGQEHALQALILLLAVVCVYSFRCWRLPVALVLSVFVLTRPEAPILVIGVFCAAVLLTRRAGGPPINGPDITVALLPFLTFVGLIVFRVIYFGDPLPNPYYAKSDGTGLTGLFNPLSGGWTYLLSGLGDTALLVVLLLLFARRGPLPDWVVVAMALLVSHVVFVVWARGDWMGQYRFLMPVLPIALLLAATGLPQLRAFPARAGFAIMAVLIVLHSTAQQLADYRAGLTTPLSEVTRVGNSFADLAERMEIEDPVLAHHDAGGIAYERMVRLVDLGGLVNRTIAKNMNDAEFLTRYLMEEVRPDFFFGARNFATASGFADSAAFARDYVPLTFTGQAHMQSDLNRIRRDRVTAPPGVELIRDASGVLVEVRVTPR